MQTAVDYHCSGTNGSSTITTTATSAISAIEDGAPVMKKAPPTVAAVANELRNRLKGGEKRSAAAPATPAPTPTPTSVPTAATPPPAAATAVAKPTTTTTNYNKSAAAGQKNGGVHLYAATECYGSTVEQMPATPTPSPDASPSKKCSSAGTAIASTNSSSSSASSALATPIRALNGQAKYEDAASEVTSVPGAPQDNETKPLPLPSQTASSFPAFDGPHFEGAGDMPETFSAASSTASTTSSTSSVGAASNGRAPGAGGAASAAGKADQFSIDADLLHWHDMPEYLQFNPYVLKGYRPLQTFKGCLLSLFYWHNETINILTHAIPIIYILAIVPGLMPWDKGYRFLCFCHVFGSVAPWCGSFVYHLFMNIERGENVYYRLLKLDMVGIWVSQSFGALPLVTATTFCFSFGWKWTFIITYCLMSFWGLYKALTASSPWQRRLCFALPFTMRSILTLLRTLGVVGGNTVALSHVYLQDGVSILGGAIGAMRIPEKWFPGLVDYYLNSHNIMHVLVVVAVYSMHKATMKDFEWMSATTCDTLRNASIEAIGLATNANIEL